MASFLSKIFGGKNKGPDSNMMDEAIAIFNDTPKDADGKASAADIASSMVKNGGFKEEDTSILTMAKGLLGGGGSGGGGLGLDQFKGLVSKIPAATFKDAAMRKVFQQFDKNNDGTIDKGELKEILSKIKTLDDSQCEKVISMCGDADSSGSLSYEEVILRINKVIKQTKK